MPTDLVNNAPSESHVAPCLVPRFVNTSNTARSRDDLLPSIGNAGTNGDTMTATTVSGSKRKRPENERDGSEQRPITEEKVGLSLLFAASLLQSAPPAVAAAPAPNSGSTTEVASLSPSIEHSIGTRNNKHEDSNHKRPSTDSDDGYGGEEGGGEDDEETPGMKSTSEQQPIITSPQQMDVCCGRGGGVNSHTGNIMYRRVVEYNKPIYRNVPKRHRMLVSQSIVQAILDEGGRFLQQEQQQENNSNHLSSKKQQQQRQNQRASSSATTSVVWKEISFRKAVQKTSQALRERIENTTTSSGAASVPSSSTNVTVPATATRATPATSQQQQQHHHHHQRTLACVTHLPNESSPCTPGISS